MVISQFTLVSSEITLYMSLFSGALYPIAGSSKHIVGGVSTLIPKPTIFIPTNEYCVRSPPDSSENGGREFEYDVGNSEGFSKAGAERHVPRQDEAEAYASLRLWHRSM